MSGLLEARHDKSWKRQVREACEAEYRISLGICLRLSAMAALFCIADGLAVHSRFARYVRRRLILSVENTDKIIDILSTNR